MSPLPTVDEFALLGVAIFNAQRVEVALYGIVAHIAHLPEAQNDKRLKNLTPEKFLRGDLKALKATLGPLFKVVGDRFMIATPDLVTFYEDRNLIAHNYYRLFHTKIGGRPKRDDGEAFLRDFVERADYWFNVLMGVLHEMIVSAHQQGRGPPYAPTARKEAQRRAYHDHVAKYLASRS